jgi:hypothetical protein
MNSEPVVQSGRGEKRTADESGEGTSEQVSESNYFTVTNVKQVKVKKFRTTGTDYTIRFTNTFANMELSQFHGRLHEIFSSLLSEVVRDVPENDQVRFVLQSPQLDSPISLPFLHASRLTTERILAEIERVVQSNHEFRLNDSVNVNVIHVEMPQGGTGTKRAEIDLEKHLASKRSVIRIQNRDNICLARALIVSIARIEKDSRDRQIRNSERPLQERLACELHERAGVPIGACGMSEVRQFQAYLTEYEINIVSKEHQNAIVYTGPVEKEKIFICICMIIITMSLQVCRPFLPENGTVTRVKNRMISRWIICVQMHVSVVVFRIVRLCRGVLVPIVIVCLKAGNVSIVTNRI